VPIITHVDDQSEMLTLKRYLAECIAGGAEAHLTPGQVKLALGFLREADARQELRGLSSVTSHHAS
jgi:hypothetical protein